MRFNSEQKIEQIRVQWEQATLLKQLEVIGARGRNWPIRDGKDQVRLIREKASTPASTTADRPATASSRRTTTSETSNGARSQSSGASAMRGEKSNLALFQPHEEEERNYVAPSGVYSPRESAKPTHRDLSEILASQNAPVNDVVSPPKKGSGKNYGASRLFELEPVDNQPKPANDIKLDPKKFKHFEFGDADEVDAEAEAAAQKAALEKRKKHASQWDFADFETPNQPKLKVLPQNARNFSWSDDEDDGNTSPIKRPVVHKERKDAKPHFEFTDDATPIADRKQQHTSNKSNSGQGLYEDHVLVGDDNDTTAGAKKPLSTVTNVSAANRQRDFDAHYSMADSSPALKSSDAGSNKENASKMNEGQKKVVNSLGANWDMYDQSPEVTKEKKIYKTSGNGMGGRKDAAAHWALGDEEYTEEAPAKPTGRTSSRQQAQKSFWDF